MDGSPIAASVALEFLTWVVWLGVFAVIQQRLCSRYPGIRTVCRVVYFSTAALALMPPLWVLFTGARDTFLLAQVNHAFGVGVYFQTSLRALLLVMWLPLRVPAETLLTEGELVTLLVGFTQIMRGHRTDAASEDLESM